MELHEQLNLVKDELSLLAFVRELHLDRTASVEQERNSNSSPYGPEARGWENTSIESFLQGALSWAEATHFGATQGLPPSNPWQKFAVFLYCGKIYE
jgi:hypothetical protein